MGRTLPPAAAPTLLQALTSVASCKVTDISVRGTYAVVQLCLRSVSASCFSVRLDDPKENCDGEKAGPWCLHWTEGEPPGEVRDAVRDALRASASTWNEPDREGAPEYGELGESENVPVQLHPRVLALASAFLIVPLLAGFVIGRRFCQTVSPWPRYFVAVASVALSFVAIELLQYLSAWDILFAGALLASGVLLGATHTRRRELLLVGTSLTIALAALEFATRRWLPHAPRFPPPEHASFIIPVGAWDRGCSALYEAADTDGNLPELRQPSLAARHKRGPVVLHLGDSMTYGSGVSDSEAFPAVLDELQPEVVHRNYGIWAVGTDFEYLLLERVLASEQPAMVILNVYVGNDVSDIDRLYECCAGGPLLDYSSSGLTARCPEPHWGIALASRLGRSPPPYPLRVATAWSHAARLATAAFSRLTFRLDLPPNFISTEGQASEQGWDHFGRIVTQMRDELSARDVLFVVTLLPSRPGLQATDPQSAPSYRTRLRLAALTAQLGIATLDAWDLFADAVKRDGAARYFLADYDIHFTPEGHRLLARWLATQLPPAHDTIGTRRVDDLLD